MPGLRIRTLDIQGFRSFGRKPQTLEFPSLLAAVWGPNSQGKTSLAEAFEFLLTGGIVRRELVASSQDEFADALRNAHMPAGVPVFVQADIVDPAGVTYTVRRRLVSDYGKKQDCTTALEIDGTQANEQALVNLGVMLSQPPLRAPVLAQHSLGYLFSARPQDRTDYFRALLEVSDLEAFRTAVAGLDAELNGSSDPILKKLDAAVSVQAAASALGPFRTAVPALPTIAEGFSAATGALIADTGEAPPSSAEARLARVEQILADKRAKTFALAGFDKQPIGPWIPAEDKCFDALTAYFTERGKLDDETRGLGKLFTEALALPGVASSTVALDCPLCTMEDSFTPSRIAYIRERLKDTEAFRDAEKGAREALGKIRRAADSATRLVNDALPRLMVVPSKKRRERGFRVDRIRTLLGPQGTAPVAVWLRKARHLWRTSSVVARLCNAIVTEIDGYARSLESLSDITVLRDRHTEIGGAVQKVSGQLRDYLAAELAVIEPLKAVVDTASRTTGWQDLIELAKGQAALRGALIENAARKQARKELEQALKEIDRGNEAVLDAKFQELSGSVGDWWNLLRPAEMSFFEAVRPRPGTRRTIDFKAGLASKPDRTDAKVRDVIAVFSQSQLHCLGLALFIARAVQEGGGFIVLDDPILSSDEDYRAFFTTGVVQKLLDLGVQIVLLTQDQKSWKDLGELYAYRNIQMFQLSLPAPDEGTIVWNTANDIRGMLARIETLIRNGHPLVRKQTGQDLRDAGERFCKEMLVKDRRMKGDQAAVISEYDGKDLGWLVPKVQPLLIKDPSHAGKLNAFRAAVNPAKHDDDIPSQGALVVAFGNLKEFGKEYLGH
jgi:hypothetical protein